MSHVTRKTSTLTATAARTRALKDKDPSPEAQVQRHNQGRLEVVLGRDELMRFAGSRFKRTAVPMRCSGASADKAAEL